MNQIRPNFYKELLQNEDLMANTIQNLIDVILIIDDDALIQFINRAGEDILDYTLLELGRKPVGKIISDEDFRFFKIIRELMTTGESRHCDLLLLTRSGERIPATFSGSVLRGQDRKIQGIIGVIRDMREYRRLVHELEEAKSGLEEKVEARTSDLAEANRTIEKAYDDLKVTKEHLRNVVASVPLGMLVLSGDLRILSSNIFFRKMIERADDDLRGLLLKDVLPDEKILKTATSVLSEGMSQSQIEVNQYSGLNERNLHVTITPIRPQGADNARLLLVVEDITEKKKAESMIRNILDTAMEGVIAANEEGKIIWVNPAAETMFGLEKEKLIGMSVEMIISEKHKERHTLAMKDFYKEGSFANLGKHYQFEGLRSNGTEFPIELVHSAFKEGNRHLITAFIRDKTEENMAADELEKAYNELKEAQAHLVQSEKMSSIGQLAAGVAHEINNPVGYVKSNIGVLSEYVEDILQLIGGYEALLSVIEAGDKEAITVEVKRVRELAQTMDVGFLLSDLSRLTAESFEGIERVREIVLNLKEFSHVDQAERQPFNINNGLESTLKIVWNDLKYKAEVIKEYGEIKEVQCYPQQINQVFINLLVNAGQAIENKGKIWVRSYMHNGYVVAEVEDTGSGIKKEHLNKVFDPFFTTKPVGKGTGLGLSITYGIVQKHGGRIDVESEVGTGTKFRVLLPIKE